MTRTLYNSWKDFRIAFAQVLARTQSELRIFDTDLEMTGLSSMINMESLIALFATRRHATVHIALRNTDFLMEQQPRLVQLLRTYSHVLKIQQIAKNIISRRDCIAIADGRHAVVRFDMEHPRSKLLLDDPVAVQPYATLFDEIWELPNAPFSPEVTGL